MLSRFNVFIKKANEILSDLEMNINPIGRGNKEVKVYRKRKLLGKYLVDNRVNIVPSVFPHIVEDFGEEKNKLAIAQYITPQSKELLRELRINFIDFAGNISFENESTFIHIENGKAFRPSPESNRAFSPKGLSVVFDLITKPELVRQNFRDIGKYSRATIDTVSKVLKGLRKEDYLNSTEKRLDRTFINLDLLIARWIDEYNLNARNKTFRFRMKTNNGKTLLSKSLVKNERIGGKSALKYYIRMDSSCPQVLYSNEPEKDILKRHNAVKSNDGDIIVYTKFWHHETHSNYIHPFLAIADVEPYLESNGDVMNRMYQKYVFIK